MAAAFAEAQRLGVVASAKRRRRERRRRGERRAAADESPRTFGHAVAATAPAAVQSTTSPDSESPHSPPQVRRRVEVMSPMTLLARDLSVRASNRGGKGPRPTPRTTPRTTPTPTPRERCRRGGPSGAAAAAAARDVAVVLFPEEEPNRATPGEARRAAAAETRGGGGSIDDDGVAAREPFERGAHRARPLALEPAREPREAEGDERVRRHVEFAGGESSRQPAREPEVATEPEPEPAATAQEPEPEPFERVAQRAPAVLSREDLKQCARLFAPWRVELASRGAPRVGIDFVVASREPGTRLLPIGTMCRSARVCAETGRGVCACVFEASSHNTCFCLYCHCRLRRSNRTSFCGVACLDAHVWAWPLAAPMAILSQALGKVFARASAQDSREWRAVFDALGGIQQMGVCTTCWQRPYCLRDHRGRTCLHCASSSFRAQMAPCFNKVVSQELLKRFEASLTGLRPEALVHEIRENRRWLAGPAHIRMAVKVVVSKNYFALSSEKLSLPPFPEPVPGAPDVERPNEEHVSKDEEHVIVLDAAEEDDGVREDEQVQVGASFRICTTNGTFTIANSGLIASGGSIRPDSTAAANLVQQVIRHDEDALARSHLPNNERERVRETRIDLEARRRLPQQNRGAHHQRNDGGGGDAAAEQVRTRPRGPRLSAETVVFGDDRERDCWIARLDAHSFMPPKSGAVAFVLSGRGDLQGFDVRRVESNDEAICGASHVLVHARTSSDEHGKSRSDKSKSLSDSLLAQALLCSHYMKKALKRQNCWFTFEVGSACSSRPIVQDEDMNCRAMLRHTIAVVKRLAASVAQAGVPGAHVALVFAAPSRLTRETDPRRSLTTFVRLLGDGFSSGFVRLYFLHSKADDGDTFDDVLRRSAAVSVEQSIYAHYSGSLRQEARRITRHENLHAAFENTDVQYTIEAMRSILVSDATTPFMAMVAARTSKGVVRSKDCVRISNGAVTSALYEQLLLQNASEGLDIPYLRTWATEGTCGSSVDEVQGKNLAIYSELLDIRHRFSRHIAAGRRLVVFWPRADRISRSLENLRSVIAEFKSWVTLVVLNPPVKILTDAFGDIGDIPESDAEFDSERHDAAFSRVCGYRAEHIGILAYALWALHIHRKKAGLDLNKPAYFAGVPIILTMDNASTLLPHTASDFRRLFADKGHWPSINSKSVAPNRGEFAKDFAKFIEQNVQKLAPHVDTPVAAMYPQKPHGTFTLPFKASDALFFVCRCIEPSGCVEGCICTCSKCTARKGCLWRSVLKRLPRWFQLVSLTLNATLCCDAHPRAV